MPPGVAELGVYEMQHYLLRTTLRYRIIYLSAASINQKTPPFKGPGRLYSDGHSYLRAPRAA